MDQYDSSDETDQSSSEEPSTSSIQRPRWERILPEIDGKFTSGYLHSTSKLLTSSYTEIGAFPHFYKIHGSDCPTHVYEVKRSMSSGSRKKGYSALDFDNQGEYLASVTPKGCLTVHKYEALYSLFNSSEATTEEDENKHLLHLNLPLKLVDVKWNPVDQKKVACVSLTNEHIPIFDITHKSSSPIRVLKNRESSTFIDQIFDGLMSLAFTSLDNSWVLASTVNGSVHVWDQRKSDFPCMKLSTNTISAINSIQLDAENRVVFGAGRLGVLYMWDTRGGRSSTVSRITGVPHHAPFASVKILPLLRNLNAIKKRYIQISRKAVHAIQLNPSCPYQLAFHLEGGWSGVMDINKLCVSHIHCHPHVWLDGSTESKYMTKPAWLSKSSIYAVGSASLKRIFLLDFHHDSTSACHVDNECDGKTDINKTDFIDLSARSTVCVAHPLTNDIVVGTRESSLLVVSQKNHSFQGDIKK